MNPRLDESMRLVEETADNIRNVMAELRPSILDDYGLTAALRWYAEGFSVRTGVACIVDPGDLASRLPTTVETALFRIAQEALTNVAKHADASQVTLALEERDGLFRLIITDDGKGFDFTALSKSKMRQGWGLITMRERAQALGRQVHLEAEPGKGTRVVVEVRR